MDLPKIVAMYRVKNEERWIEKSLKAVSEIVDEIVIFDDDSSDMTIDICKKFTKVVDIYHQIDAPLDESRDKNILLQMALNRNPDYLLALDGDEIFAPDSKEILYKELMSLYRDVDIFEFQFLYVWDAPNTCRYDGYFGNTWHPRMIKMKNQPENLFFNNSGYPGNLHCGSIPNNASGKSVKSAVKILHYGYYDEELRKKKFRFYTAQDPNSELQDGYSHILSGKGRFSGPLGIEIRVLPEGSFIPDIK